MRSFAWVPTDGTERPPPGCRCAVAWSDDEGRVHFDLSVYLDVTDQWDDSTDVNECTYQPFATYSHFIPLPELSP